MTGHNYNCLFILFYAEKIFLKKTFQETFQEIFQEIFQENFLGKSFWKNLLGILSGKTFWKISSVVNNVTAIYA